MRIKKHSNQTIAFILLGVFAVGIVGCGNNNMGSGMGYNSAITGGISDMKYEMDASYQYEADSEEAPAMMPEQKDSGEEQLVKKLVYTANLEMETRTYEESKDAIRKAVESKGGYLEEVAQYGSAENGNRYYNITIRIPADQYRAFLDEAGTLGSITYQNESMRDITTNYIDVEARLKSLEEQRNRLNELQKKANSLEELLEIEKRLSEIQYQLENYEGQRKYMDRQVSYSTIHLNLREVVEYTPANTFVSRLKRAMTGTWSDFFGAMGELLIGIIYLLPYLLLLVVLVLAIRCLWRRYWKKREERKEKENQNGFN